MAPPLHALVLLLLASPLSTMASTDPLEAFEWKHRIVLAFDAEGAAGTLTGAQPGIEERHIIWFAVGPEGSPLKTNLEGELREDFGQQLSTHYRKAPETQTEVVLIGKDGGVKSRDPKLNLEKIFARIDAMPMRQAEMRRQ